MTKAAGTFRPREDLHNVVPFAAGSLSEKVLQNLVSGGLSKSEIADSVGKEKVDGQLNNAVRNLIEQGLIEYTRPEKPQSRLQKYRLTEGGRYIVSKKKG